MMIYELKKNKILKISLYFLYSYFLFFNISLFFIFSFILFVTKMYILIDEHKNFYFINIAVFYFLRFVFATSEKFNQLWSSFSLSNISFADTKFFDLQQNLVSMKCIVTNVDKYYYKHSSSSYISCPFSAKYGPLSTKVPYIGDIWIGTLIFSIIALLSLILISKKSMNSQKHNFFTAFLFLSPSANFLLERMNIDVFIFLLALLCVLDYSRYPKSYTCILLFLSLYKLHPLGFLLGLIFYFAIKKNREYFQINFNSLILFSILYILDSIYSKSILATEWRPADISTTFGLLSDSLILSNFTNVDSSKIYFLLLFCIFFLSFLVSNNNFKFKDVSESHQRMFVCFSFLVILNFFYANYDYRLALFLPISYLIYLVNSDNKFLHYFIFLMPIGAEIFPSSFTKNIELFLSIIGRTSIYFFVAYIFSTLYKELRKMTIKGFFEFVLNHE